MPTYEYECSEGHQFEVVQRITEEPIERCEICGAKARRLISSANFILKGGGWFSDGYSGDGSKSRSSSTAESSSAGDSPEASKSPTDSSTSDSKATSSGSSKD